MVTAWHGDALCITGPLWWHWCCFEKQKGGQFVIFIALGGRGP